MSAWVFVALSFVPGLCVIAWHLRERAKLRRFEKAREADIIVTLNGFEDEERNAGMRESFSAWPMGPKGKR